MIVRLAQGSAQDRRAFESTKCVRVAAGAAWVGERLEPAITLAASGEIDTLCLGTVSERALTDARALQLIEPAMQRFDPQLCARMAAVLPLCVRGGVRVITNGGWDDPVGAAVAVQQLLRDQNLQSLRVASVDVTVPICDGAQAEGQGPSVWWQAEGGADGITRALRAGADVVVAGVTPNRDLYAAAIAHGLNWSTHDVQRMGRAVLVGHLLAGGARLCGAGWEDHAHLHGPDLHDCGQPVAQVSEGHILLRKRAGAGGRLTELYARAQLLHEVHDPRQYASPEATVDLEAASFHPVAPDEMEVRLRSDAAGPGARTLGVPVTAHAGFTAQDTMLFSGPDPVRSAKLARDLLVRAIAAQGLVPKALRMDVIGVNAVQREMTRLPLTHPVEVGLRVAARTETQAQAIAVMRTSAHVAAEAVGGCVHLGSATFAAFASSQSPVAGIAAQLIGVRPAIALDYRYVPRERARVVVKLWEGTGGDAQVIHDA